MEFLTGAVQKEDLGIAEILAGDYEGKNIKVKGAIHTIRDMGEVAFIVLRRRDGLIQCVYEPGKSRFSVDDLKEADTVEVCGTYKNDDRSPNGFELRLSRQLYGRIFPYQRRGKALVLCLPDME